MCCYDVIMFEIVDHVMCADWSGDIPQRVLLHYTYECNDRTPLCDSMSKTFRYCVQMFVCLEYTHYIDLLLR